MASGWLENPYFWLTVLLWNVFLLGLFGLVVLGIAAMLVPFGIVLLPFQFFSEEVKDQIVEKAVSSIRKNLLNDPVTKKDEVEEEKASHNVKRKAENAKTHGSGVLKYIYGSPGRAKRLFSKTHGTDGNQDGSDDDDEPAEHHLEPRQHHKSQSMDALSKAPELSRAQTSTPDRRVRFDRPLRRVHTDGELLSSKKKPSSKKLTKKKEKKTGLASLASFVPSFKFKLPSVPISMPSFKLPSTTLPDFKMPNISSPIKMPTFTSPIKLPSVAPLKEYYANSAQGYWKTTATREKAAEKAAKKENAEVKDKDKDKGKAGPAGSKAKD